MCGRVQTDTASQTRNLRNQYLNARINSLPAKWQVAKAEAQQVMDSVKSQDVTVGQAVTALRVGVEAYVLFKVGQVIGYGLSPKKVRRGLVHARAHHMSSFCGCGTRPGGEGAGGVASGAEDGVVCVCV